MTEPTTTNPDHQGEPEKQGKPDKPAARSSTRSFAVLALVCIVALMLWQRFVPVKSAVDWQLDFEAALKASAETGKPVLIKFSSVGCTYCRQMETEVYPQEAVLTELAKFVPVKVDAFADEALSARYDVNGLPGYVVVDAKGKVLARTEGYHPAENFVRFLKRAHAAAKSQTN